MRAFCFVYAPLVGKSIVVSMMAHSPNSITLRDVIAFVFFKLNILFFKANVSLPLNWFTCLIFNQDKEILNGIDVLEKDPKLFIGLEDKEQNPRDVFMLLAIIRSFVCF